MTRSTDPSNELPAEFGFIARHFRPLAGPGSLDLADDAAVFLPPAGRELVVTADAAIQGVHFRPHDPPDTIGRKVLRTNLSDLAAMGAAPLGYLLTLAIPRGIDDTWFRAFAHGLAEDQRAFGITLLGGDTTAGSQSLVVSITAIGHVATGAALRRNGARAGDAVWVTGTIGDAALGLRDAELADVDGFLARRYLLPEPRLGLSLAGIAHAAIDISDGLVQDCAHMARESGVSVCICADAVPLSAAAQAAGPAWMSTCLSGGDDYELLLAVPPENERALTEHARRVGIPVTRIGSFSAQAANEATVTVVDRAGNPLPLMRQGWDHLDSYSEPA